MCPWGKCPGGTCPGGFCPVTLWVVSLLLNGDYTMTLCIILYPQSPKLRHLYQNLVLFDFHLRQSTLGPCLQKNRTSVRLDDLFSFAPLLKKQPAVFQPLRSINYQFALLCPRPRRPLIICRVHRFTIIGCLLSLLPLFNLSPFIPFFLAPSLYNLHLTLSQPGRSISQNPPPPTNPAQVKSSPLIFFLALIFLLADLCAMIYVLKWLHMTTLSNYKSSSRRVFLSSRRSHFACALPFYHFNLKKINDFPWKNFRKLGDGKRL